MWEQTIPYPNEEHLHEDLLRKVCLAQIRTKENMGVSLEDERYYSLILSDPKQISSIKLEAITSEEEMYRCIDGSDNGPIWKRYEKIKERISTYDKAIEAAKQAGETEIQKSLENALDRLKKKAHFTLLDESKQYQIEGLIRGYLGADELYCRCIESLAPSAIKSALCEMIPAYILAHTIYTSALDIAQELGIIGIYAPRIRDTGFNKPTSGIVFAKDAIYLKLGKAEPECIPYSLISGIKTGFKSVSFTLKGDYTDKKLAESGFVFDCFSASTNQKLLQLFSDICKLN